MELQLGQVVRVRSRQYLVEDVVAPPREGDSTLVRLSCLDDDAQGQQLEVLWETEVDAEIIGAANWHAVAQRGFDPPSLFAAYLHALRWNCVTSTDPKLFQAPYRAGIQIHAYQLEPLRKALMLPRVNLFIADDVGLGKTIEAGLILRELLMRQKVRRVVVACPPSLVTQWRDELDARFGLPMVIFDRDFVLRCRRERGYSVNPWSTHSRFIVSHALLRDETYATPLRDWLGDAEPCPGSMLILDEAHNAAPASGARYAIDSKFTKIVRELAPHFEHRLFLSATPHNGHSNSFSALLEILDPQRFCRGDPIRSAKQLDSVMVRRLKSDLRESQAAEFPDRKVVQLDIDGLPEDAPELALARLLQEYRDLREQKVAGARKSAQAAAMLIVTSLQKRLLSSIEAFACTLNVHRKSLERKKARGASKLAAAEAIPKLALVAEAPGADDDAAELTEEELRAEEESQVALATEIAESEADALSAREQGLLDEMARVAEASRHQPDARVRRLVAWLREHCCPGKPGTWNDRRVLIFTEYLDTKRYLEQILSEEFAKTDNAEERFATFHGGMGADEKKRDAIKLAFNSDPSRHLLRVLIATDAAREGVNLQNHCSDLFHFDVPWNPSRMEQRNGRIDRKLQRAPEVRCHYFFYRQRREDIVLRVLVKKSDTIQRQLGSLAQVIEGRLAKTLSSGIRARDIERLTRAIEDEGPGDKHGVTEAELEGVRERQEKLGKQVDTLRKLLESSQNHLGLSEKQFRNAVDQSLSLLGAPPLKRKGSNGTASWEFPDLSQRKGADASWVETLDTLRGPRPRDLKLWDWRRKEALRPIVFRDVGSLDNETVHLHLEHRVVQRLLGRFLAQGFVHDDLARACVVVDESPIPRVVLLGRLSLYGHRAARLHDEVISVTAQWTEPAGRKKPLKPYGDSAEAQTLKLLEQALADPSTKAASKDRLKHIQPHVERDVAELLGALNERAEEKAARAKELLAARAEKEAKDMLGLLQSQKERLQELLGTPKPVQQSFEFADEYRQVEAERKAQERRLVTLEQELASEPQRIRDSYEVHATRVEPVGVVYLWPVTG